MNTDAQPMLQLVFEGPAIRDNNILFSDLADFVTNFRLAVQKIVTILETGISPTLGRPRKSVQDFAALEIMTTFKGSFGITLNLRRDETRLPGFDVGETAVYRVIDGLRNIGQQALLPDGFDSSVLIALREAGKVLDRGIDVVRIESPRHDPKISVAYISATRERIRNYISRFEQTWATVEGRLLMADFKEDAQRCRLHPSVGDPILCKFGDEIAPSVMNNLREFVRVRGEASRDSLTGEVKLLVVRDIEAITEPADEISVITLPGGFWETKSFDDIAAEQSVYPIDNLDVLIQDWPEDEDIDEFLAEISRIRQEE